MTGPTAIIPAMDEPLEPHRLPLDTLRSLIAGILVTLAVLGWLAFAINAEMRSALRTQTALWWVEQAFVAVHAVACVGLMLRVRAAWWPAVVLTALYLAQLAGLWVLAVVAGRFSLNVSLFLSALLMWRLFASRPPRAA